MSDTKKKMKVVTRFAPSSGSLYMNDARIALFNYLFANHYGGDFFVRIKDTNEGIDQNLMYQALHWLGLANTKRLTDSLNVGWVTQNNKKSQQNIANFLVCQDRAYRDGNAIRIKGYDISDDYALLCENGSPTLMLANVCDDHEQGVTHIIRGTEQIDNQTRQGVLWDAMGWNKPEYIHIGLIISPDSEMSNKMINDTSILDYRDMGIFPEAMCNYLCELGWSRPDKNIFHMCEAIKWFDGSGVNQLPLDIDQTQLNTINQHYIKSAAFRPRSTE